ncbi:hypothetical protein BRD00_07370 [Halobacteriales archaeon QS_8_69_26]|nr:MAG: hypothetical protein BRD00_07370 [Halobacteriales archaeon QS_8_69_26]
MTAPSDGFQVPHALLSGDWEVLRETDDGRPAVALRDDGVTGVALAYPPGAEAKVALVVNAEAEFVLLTARLGSLSPVGDLASDPETMRIPASELDAMDRARVTAMLSDGNPLVVVPDGDGWDPCVLQLFEAVQPARETWAARFPDLDERTIAVKRLVDDVDLGEVAKRIDDTRSGSHSP